jgi:hypothetical protein
VRIKGKGVAMKVTFHEWNKTGKYILATQQLKPPQYKQITQERWFAGFHFIQPSINPIQTRNAWDAFTGRQS